MGLSKALRVAARGVSTSSAARMSLPALTTAQAKPSLMSAIFGGAAGPAMPPMDQPVPGLAIPDPPVAPATAPGTIVTTLSNGAKIASEDTNGASLAVGMYIAAGSKNENPYTTGAAHLLERMAFKATKHRTAFRVTREAEVIGANLLASASREQMAYTVDCLKTNLPEAVELLADTVMNPKLADHEVADVANALKAEMTELAANPANLMMEAVHAVAFDGGLGQPLVASAGALSRMDGDTLAHFVQQNYTAPRVVLAASGCAHEDLVAVAEPLLAQLPAGDASSATAPSKDVGGDYRVASDSPVANVVLAFEFAGGWKDTKASTAMTVLNTLMGGGGSFSAGGPGKGMYSRLYTRVLNKHAWAQNCTAFHSVFDDVGVVGISGVADGDRASDMVAVMAQEFAAVASGAVTEEELARAKAATVSSILMNLESKAIVAEDIGRQILTYGERKAPSEFIAQVNALTVADVAAVAKKCVASKPTLVMVGDLSAAPRYEALAGMF
jgi:processing peptidase subunit alpha